jgi:hypothetical protein
MDGDYTLFQSGLGGAADHRINGHGEFSTLAPLRLLNRRFLGHELRLAMVEHSPRTRPSGLSGAIHPTVDFRHW